MKKLILLFTIVASSTISVFGQYTTSVIGLGAPNTTIRIDTDPSIVTLTLTGASNRWLAVGFGVNATTMASATDMFIWNDTTDRDYTPDTSSNSGHNMPIADTDQSWTIVSDVVSSGIRTVKATRPLVSPGDFTFLNNSSFLQVLFAQGDTPTLAYHGTTNVHGTNALTRFFTLSLNEYSLKSSSVYPNPTKGSFVVKTNTSLDKISIYNQTGEIVKTINVDGQKEENEITISDLATGVYILELQNATEKSSKKIVVE